MYVCAPRGVIGCNLIVSWYEDWWSKSSSSARTDMEAMPRIRIALRRAVESSEDRYSDMFVDEGKESECMMEMQSEVDPSRVR